MFTPIIIKIIVHLRNSKKKISIDEIIAIMQDNPDRVNTALDRLLAMGLVAQEGNTYIYNCSDRNNEIINRMLKLYEAVSSGTSKESLIRGVLCQVPSQYLLHLTPLKEIFKGEGIDDKELDDFLQKEKADNYLEIKRVVYVKKKVPFIRMCMPPYYFNYLVEKRVICDEKGQSFMANESEDKFQEEDYLITRYPQQIEAAAKEYLEQERQELAAYLRRRGLAEWSR